MKIINDALGLRLKKLRKFKKMSQVAFGEAVNLSQQAIVGIETGKRETTVTRLVDIANFVDTTLDYLSGRSAIGFHDIMLDLIENSILYDFLFATDRPEEAFDDILKNVEERDYIDSHREVSPLRKADDAIELDNSNMTIPEQKQWLMDRFRERTAQ